MNDREKLDLFVEKARILANGEFVRSARNEGLAVRLEVNRVDQSVGIAHLRPQDEAMFAMANTFRFFLQNNEPISFQKLPQLYGAMSQTSRDHCEYIVKRMSDRLQLRPYALETGGKPIILEYIKEVFLYGHYSHSTKHEIYKEWERNQAAFPLMRFYFDSAVAEVLEAIFAIAYIIERELSGKCLPSLSSRICLARMLRAKEASEWKSIFPAGSQHQQETFQRLSAVPAIKIEADQPMPTLQFRSR